MISLLERTCYLFRSREILRKNKIVFPQSIAEKQFFTFYTLNFYLTLRSRHNEKTIFLTAIANFSVFYRVCIYLIKSNISKKNRIILYIFRKI
jgi:hypothetical protein